MDQGTLQGIGTLLALLAFCAICWWAFSGRNKSRFEEAAQLPFADDTPLENKNSSAIKTVGASAASEASAAQVSDNAGSNL